MMFNYNRVGIIYFAEFPIYTVIYSLIEKGKILINNDN